MSITSSIPCIKIKIKFSNSPSILPSKFHSPKPYFAIRSSNAESPLRRPTSPSLSPPAKPAMTSPSPAMTSAAEGVKGMVTLEFQRKMAKDLQEYFREKKSEESDQGPFFGFLGKNEITNGRWAMFGFAVGLLTEYATAADFVQQLKILLSNFGVVDLD